ncbi:DUF1801 domain-containing protein [Sphingobacterium sp. LRF_L2]|uniref:DUF1801 domain-containing protein n=1 Tax=Sphingobacterium sp. LRF_L2 TaxID=3369421 RepID=UPI003F614F45
MAKNKTQQYTSDDVREFIDVFADTDQKRADSLILLQILSDISGYTPKLWGTSIIGFGNYHYKYASGHEGDAPILGFSPRKSAFSLYIYSDTEKSRQLLADLGKFKMGKACIYVKKLSDINLSVLKELFLESIAHINFHYQIL